MEFESGAAKADTAARQRLGATALYVAAKLNETCGACPTAASFSEATDVGEFCGKNLVRLSCFMQGGGFGEGRMPHGEVERDLEGGMRWGATWKEG